ncbi:MAG: type II secretion system protein GspG [Phycisphaerae bacterium]
MNSICKAAKQYYDRHGVAPASMDEIQTYDDSVSTEDPWGRALTYSVEGTVIRLCSFGADGAEGGEGKDRDLVIEYCVKEDDYPRRIRREQGTR